MPNSTKKTLPVTGRLEQWAIHDIGRFQVATGLVYEDTKGRFHDGAYIQTSAIVAIDEGESITTRNSFYVLGEKHLDKENESV